MRDRQPLLSPTPPKGRIADRLIAGVALFALIASIGATMWFFAGFYETDPGFGPASSAFLLSLGLGAFAIIPSAVILRLSWTAWKSGFQLAYGGWTLLLAGPWIGLGALSLRSGWLPLGLGLMSLMAAIPMTIWAIVSLWLDRPRRSKM